MKHLDEIYEKITLPNKNTINEMTPNAIFHIFLSPRLPKENFGSNDDLLLDSWMSALRTDHPLEG